MPQQRSKKRKVRKRRKVIYLDVIVIDVVDFSVRKTNGDIKFLKKSFCKLSTLTQELNTCVSKNKAPVWNSDFTFMMRDNNEELMIELYEKKNKQKLNFLGQVALYIKNYEFEKMYDLCEEIQPPPSCESGKYIVSGTIHYTFYKSYNPRKMPLSHYGLPTYDLPMRIDVGDIILCSSRNILTHTVHISTRSQWDHVAMIVKRRGNVQLRLFEATMDGVETYLLSTALKYYRENCKVAIRRVLLKKGSHFEEELYNFVEEVLGRPYKQDWIQLVRAAYNANEEDDLTSLFCSQLIAAAYQRLDIISKDIPSNNFVPSDFANDLQGQLKGARIDQTRKIPSMRKTVILRKEEVPSETFDGVHYLYFDLKDIDLISNVKITETATKRDAKLQTHTVYIMNVSTKGGLKWILFKRFHEFVDLDKELRKYYDGVPKITKKITVNKFDASTIQHRRTALQRYIKSLCNSPIVRCSLFVDFLTIGRKGVVQENKENTENKGSKDIDSNNNTAPNSTSATPTSATGKEKDAESNNNKQQKNKDSKDHKSSSSSSSSSNNHSGGKNSHLICDKEENESSLNEPKSQKHHLRGEKSNPDLKTKSKLESNKSNDKLDVKSHKLKDKEKDDHSNNNNGSSNNSGNNSSNNNQGSGNEKKEEKTKNSKEKEKKKEEKEKDKKIEAEQQITEVETLSCILSPRAERKKRKRTNTKQLTESEDSSFSDHSSVITSPRRFQKSSTDGSNIERFSSKEKKKFVSSDGIRRESELSPLSSHTKNLVDRSKTTRWSMVRPSTDHIPSNNTDTQKASSSSSSIMNDNAESATKSPKSHHSSSSSSSSSSTKEKRHHRKSSSPKQIKKERATTSALIGSPIHSTSSPEIFHWLKVTKPKSPESTSRLLTSFSSRNQIDISRSTTESPPRSDNDDVKDDFTLNDNNNNGGDDHNTSSTSISTSIISGTPPFTKNFSSTTHHSGSQSGSWTPYPFVKQNRETFDNLKKFFMEKSPNGPQRCEDVNTSNGEKRKSILFYTKKFGHLNLDEEEIEDADEEGEGGDDDEEDDEAEEEIEGEEEEGEGGEDDEDEAEIEAEDDEGVSSPS